MFNLCIENTKQTARFLLGNSGRKNLLVVGLNPSTAHATQSDTTMTKMIKFAQMHTYDGVIMANLYPQRATLPDNLHQRINKKLHQSNIEHIEKIISNHHIETAILAWGNGIKTRRYLTQCFLDIKLILLKYHIKIQSIGSPSKKGHPKHPSRLSYSNSFEDFDLESYGLL